MPIAKGQTNKCRVIRVRVLGLIALNYNKQTMKGFKKMSDEPCSVYQGTFPTEDNQ